MTSRQKRTNQLSTKYDIDGKQSPCLHAVAEFFGVADKCRYLHTCNDMINVLRRKQFNVRSRLSSIKKGSSIGTVRNQLDAFGRGFYIVCVEGHILIMNRHGRTIVDTDPRQRDRRKVVSIHKVYRTF